MGIKKPLLLFASLQFVSVFAFCQLNEFDNYTPLKSKGLLPKFLTYTATEKFEAQQESIVKSEKKELKKLKEEFYLKSTFSNDDLLRGGKIIYNDTVSSYLTGLFSKVKSAANVNEESVRVLLFKSNTPNAFASDDGYIFITTGLISRLKNEAQLVFILCHELIHYKNKHSIDGFIKDNTAFKSNAYSNNIDMLASAAYSKEKETEADAEGFVAFKKLGYKLSDIRAVFEVLSYVHLPFEDVTFDKWHFTYGGLQWPNSFSLLEPDTIAPIKENNVLFSTHPALNERKELLAKFIDSVDDETQALTNSYNDTFFYIRKVCRFEDPLLALKNRDYCEAIYTALILLKENPNSVYLKKLIAKSLYGLATYYNYNQKATLDIDYLDTEGEFQQTLAFFQNINVFEINALAVNYIWRLKKELGNDDEIDLIFTKSMDNFTLLHANDITTFKSDPLPDSLQINRSRDIIYFDYVIAADARNNNGSRLIARENAVKIDSIIKADYLLRKQRFPYFFNTLIDDGEFVAAFKESAGKSSALVERVSKYYATLSNNGTFFDQNEINPYYKVVLDSFYTEKNYYKKLKTDSLNAKFAGRFNTRLKKHEGEKTIIYNPVYYSIDQRDKVPLKFIASEKTRTKFFKQLKKSAIAAKVPVTFLADDDFEQTETDKINTITLVSDWLKEFYIHQDIDIVPVDYNEINQLSERYGTRYISFATNLFVIRKKTDIASYVALSIIIPIYSWPLTFPYFFNKDVRSGFYMFTLDLKTRTLVADTQGGIRAKNTDDILLSSFYSFFNQLKLAQCAY